MTSRQFRFCAPPSIGRRWIAIAMMLFVAALCPAAWAGEMKVGWAHINLTPEVTPEHPVLMTGLLIPRYTSEVESPLTATALALEVTDASGKIDQVIFVSIDIGTLSFGFVEGDGPLVTIRKRLEGRLPGFDLSKLVTMATHDHTVPNFDVTRYGSQRAEAFKPEEIYESLLARICDVAEAAWKNRHPGSLTWGLGHAVLAKNRRTVYPDGHAVMGGARKDPNFSHIEGGEDHGVEMVFFWDLHDKLSGVLVNVACPAQTNSQKLAITADYWDEVRKRLRAQPDFANADILPMLATAGDAWPTYYNIRDKAEVIMRDRRGLSHSQEMGRRVADAVLDVFPYVQKNREKDVRLAHRIERMDIPYRVITEKDAAQAKAEYDKLERETTNPFRATEMQKFQMILKRYERQRQQKLFTKVELHVLRLNDLAIATNPFELFLDYGLQMKARSPAVLTLTAEIAAEIGQYQGYLATERAIQAGGYSAEVLWFNYVGPDGGKMIVDRTVEVIHELWK